MPRKKKAAAQSRPQAAPPREPPQKQRAMLLKALERVSAARELLEDMPAFLPRIETKLESIYVEDLNPDYEPDGSDVRDAQAEIEKALDWEDRELDEERVHDALHDLALRVGRRAKAELIDQGIELDGAEVIAAVLSLLEASEEVLTETLRDVETVMRSEYK